MTSEQQERYKPLFDFGKEFYLAMKQIHNENETKAWLEQLSIKLANDLKEAK